MGKARYCSQNDGPRGSEEHGIRPKAVEMRCGIGRNSEPAEAITKLVNIHFMIYAIFASYF